MSDDSDDYTEQNSEGWYKGRAGRPAKFDVQKACRAAEIIFARGGTLTELAAELCVNRDTIYDWMSKDSQFSDVIEIGKLKSEAYYIGLMRDNIVTSKETKFNTGPLSLLLRNCFGWQTRDANNDNGGTVTININGTQAAKIIDVAEEDQKLITSDTKQLNTGDK